MIDEFNLIPVWGIIGHLKGYCNGLRMRIAKTSLNITEKDLEYFEVLIKRLEKSLAKASGFKGEK